MGMGALPVHGDGYSGWYSKNKIREVMLICKSLAGYKMEKKCLHGLRLKSMDQFSFDGQPGMDAKGHMEISTLRWKGQIQLQPTIKYWNS